MHYPYDERVTDQIVNKYRFNIVGILGEESDTAYVEIGYAEATKDEKNKIVHKWVKPPLIWSVSSKDNSINFSTLKTINK